MISYRECGERMTVKSDNEYTLRMETEGLTLVSGELSLRGDFTKMQQRLRRGNIGQELLVKAARIKDPQALRIAVDATAGLGDDSFLLAAAGWTVYMCEFDPVIAALLKDALVRGAEIPELADTIRRMHLLEGDSRELLKGLTFHPDIVLLDPMFPGRQKSGLVKKKAQLLQKLEKPCEDEEGLLQAAISARPRKIVIKRPLKGPFLAGRKPDYSITGKTIRYDCLLVTTA